MNDQTIGDKAATRLQAIIDAHHGWHIDLDLRDVLEDRKELLARLSERDQTMARIRAVEIHGGEFVDADELYRALGEPKPNRPDIDHAANIRSRALLHDPDHVFKPGADAP